MDKWKYKWLNLWMWEWKSEQNKHATFIGIENWAVSIVHEPMFARRIQQEFSPNQAS